MRSLAGKLMGLVALGVAAPAHGGSLRAEQPASVPMTVQQVTARSGSHVVLLQNAAGDLVVPIWIGEREAQAIQMGLSSTKAPRPLTHDLLGEVIRRLGARIQRVEVAAVRDNVFIGKLTLRERTGRTHDIDARPSDLIALAVAHKLPVFVAPQVIDRTGVRKAAPAVEGGVPGGVAPTDI